MPWYRALPHFEPLTRLARMSEAVAGTAKEVAGNAAEAVGTAFVSGVTAIGAAGMAAGSAVGAAGTAIGAAGTAVMSRIASVADIAGGERGGGDVTVSVKTCRGVMTWENNMILLLAGYVCAQLTE